MMDETAARAWIAERWGDAKTERLEKLLDLLDEENGRQNLVSAKSLEEAWLRHIVDSAQLIELAGNIEAGRWLDIGTGAGFPGLVIAILRSDIDVVLVEPRKRRIEWLEAAHSALQLQNVTVLHRRIETVEPFVARVISARAVASLRNLIAWGAPFSTNETMWLLPKGRSARQELEEAKKSVRNMFHVEQSLTDPDAAILVGNGRAKVRQ